jgi:hypothetical protein
MALELRKTELSERDGTKHTVWVIWREFNGENYYFNYAYDEADHQMALTVIGNLRAPRNHVSDVQTDLSFNFVNVKRVIGIGKRTTQKRTWYVTRQSS